MLLLLLLMMMMLLLLLLLMMMMMMLLLLLLLMMMMMMMMMMMLLLLELTQWCRGTGGRGYDWSRLTYKYYRNAVLLHSLTRVVSHCFAGIWARLKLWTRLQLPNVRRVTCDV